MPDIHRKDRADMAYPPVRYVNVFPLDKDGDMMFGLQDPEELCGGTLVVPPALMLIMSLLDGQRGPEEIQEEFARITGGEPLPTEDLEGIVSDLDEHYLLSNDRSQARRQILEADFARLATRPATHAGTAYPSDAAECRKFFDSLFDGADGHPGNPQVTPDHPLPRGIICPHIDLRIGGRCLARSLAPLKPSPHNRLYIILGVAHNYAPNLFTLTDKAFETPLGLVETDKAASQKLRALYGDKRLDGEYIHKQEHSIEFTTIALQHLHQTDADFKILPILCGSLHDWFASDAPRPIDAPDVGEFINSLRQIIRDHDGEICLIASVDLSHVGKKFNDEAGVDEARAQQVREADDRMLKHIEALEPEAFFDHFRADANSRNVDAVTAVYVLLHTLQSQGDCRRIDYEQWIEKETDSMVTYAGLTID